MYWPVSLRVILISISVAAMSCLWSSLFLFIYISQSESSTEFAQTKSPSDSYKYHTAYPNIASAVRCSLYCTQLSGCTGYTYDVTTSTCSLIRDRCVDHGILIDDRGNVVTYMKDVPAPVIDPTLARGKHKRLYLDIEEWIDILTESKGSFNSNSRGGSRLLGGAQHRAVNCFKYAPG